MDRPLDVDVDVLERQAALFADLLVVLAGPLELGIDEGDQRRLVADAVDEQPLRRADLRRGEADSERVVHQRAHVVDLRAERLVEGRDLGRPALQDRVAELADEAEGVRTARRHLGVEPVLDFLVDLFDLEVLVLGFVICHYPKV